MMVVVVVAVLIKVSVLLQTKLLCGPKKWLYKLTFLTCCCCRLERAGERLWPPPEQRETICYLSALFT